MTETLEVEEAVQPNIVTIQISKGGIKFDATCDFDRLPLEVYQDFLVRGYKDWVSTNGMSKMVGGSKLEGAELEKFTKDILAIRDRNNEIAYGIPDPAGGPSKLHPDYKRLGQGRGAAKVTGAEKQEALIVAKKIVKDSLKRAKKKIGDYKPSVISALAKELLEQQPQIYDTARANLAARAKVAEGIQLDVSRISADPERVQKNAANAEKRKKGKTGGPISKTQAGLVAPARPRPGSPAVH